MTGQAQRRWSARSLGAPALLLAVVLPVLVLVEVRPALGERRAPWPGHPEGFTLPAWLPGDCPFYRATARSLLREGDLDLRDDVAWEVLRPEGQVALGARGEWYPKHPILLAVLALPLYAALGDGGLLLFNLLQLAALDVLLLLLARRYAGEGAALATALAFALFTLLRPAAANFSPDVLSTALVVGGTLALLGGRPLMGGALFGLAVAARWTNLGLLLVAAVWIGATGGALPLERFAIGAAPALVLLGALNLHMFGSPLTTPYDRVVGGFPGGTPVLEASHRTFFDRPFLAGLWEQLSDGRLGLFRSAPPVLLAPLGFVLIFRRARAEAALLAGLCAVQLATFAPYRQWAAASYGHRFLLSVVALCAAPVAALASRYTKTPRKNPSATGADSAQAQAASATSSASGASRSSATEGSSSDSAR